IRTCVRIERQRGASSWANPLVGNGNGGAGEAVVDSSRIRDRRATAYMGSGDCMTDRGTTSGLEDANVKRRNESGMGASDRGVSRITLALGVAVATALALVTISSPFGRGGTVGA